MSESKQQVSGAAREALRESLSAAVDGEATQLELRRVLNAMGNDADLRAEWARAHLVGAVARGAVRCRAAADRPWLREAAAVPVAARSRAAWLWPAAGVAATVSALAIVLAFAPSGDPQPARNVAQTKPPVADGLDYAGLASTPSDADLQRVSNYMLRHAHQSSLAPAGPVPVGTAPFVRVLVVQDGDNVGKARPYTVGNRR